MIKHNKPTIGIEEQLSAKRVLESEWLSPGENVRSFENEFSKYLGLENGSSICISSGSAAMYLILSVLGYKNKKIVIPSYTCVALKNAVELSGNSIECFDTKNNSFNICAQKFDDSNLDFCILPSMYGEILSEKDYKTKNILFDNCQSLGSKLNGKPIGSLSEISFYSFYSTKIITSGGHGGMIASKDKKLIKEIKDRIYFDEKIDSKQRFNFQMTDLQASIGRVQLNRLDDLIDQRKKIYNRYLNNGIKLLNFNSPKDSKETNFFRAILYARNNKGLINYLNKKGVNAINPLKFSELISKESRMKNSINNTKNFISLPIFPDLTYRDVDKISELINKYFNDFNSSSTSVHSMGRIDT
tara:strand:+ start:3573 stop:4646 length:1074 start_codon:yes stop_codon:yes gene_type:complete